MDEWIWEQLERLTRALALLLLREKTPQGPVPLPEVCEQAIDVWVRTYARSSRVEFVFPVYQLQRQGLLARLSAATAFAMQARLAALPLRSVSGQVIDLEALLVEHWRATAKARWLAGAHRPLQN